MTTTAKCTIAQLHTKMAAQLQSWLACHDQSYQAARIYITDTGCVNVMLRLLWLCKSAALMLGTAGWWVSPDVHGCQYAGAELLQNTRQGASPP